MDTKTLKLRIVADVSSLKNSLNDAKKSMSSISSSGLSEETNSAATNLEEVKGSLNAIKNISLANTFKNFIPKNITGQVGEIIANLEEVKNYVSGAFSKEIVKGYSEAFDTTKTGAFMSLMFAGFTGVGASIKAALSSLKAMLSTTKALVTAVTLLAAAFVALAVNAFTTAKNVFTLTKEAEKIGVSADTYQKWGYILKQNGIEIDKLTDFVRTLTSAQVSLREGSEDITAAFTALGIESSKAANMGQEQLFMETVTALQEMENATMRTQIAYKLFGEDAAQLTPILNLSNIQMQQLLSNYQALSGGTSQRLISLSTQLQTSLNSLGVAWTGLRNVLAEFVLPIIIPVITWLTKALAIIRMFLSALFGITGSSSGFDSVSGSASSAAASINSATEAANEFKRVTMGFDELNIVSDPNSGSAANSGAALGGGAGSLGIEVPTIESLGLDGVAEWFEENAKAINVAASLLLPALGIIMAIFGISSGMIPLAIAGIALAGLGISIGMGEGGVWNTVFTGIADLAMWLWNTIKGLLDTGWNFIKGLIDGIATIVSGFFNGIWIFIQSTVTLIVGICSTIGITVANLVSSIFNFIGSIPGWIWENVLSPVINWIKSAASFIYDNAIVPVIDFFKGLGTSIYNLFIKPFIDAATTIKNKVVDLFKNIGSTVSGFISGAIKGVINGVFSLIENSINFFIGMLNDAVWLINKIPGVNIGYVNEVKLPRLATGGIVTKSTIANIGEAGREAVLPLDRNTGWMDILASKIGSTLGGAPTVLQLVVDGKVLGQTVITNINDITRANGRIPLNLV